MVYTTRAWLHGLLAAFIGAFASSAGAILVAPDRFNLTSVLGLRNVALSSIISGFVAAMAYLKQSPLPPLDQKVTEEKTSTLQVSGGAVTASQSTVTTTETAAK